MLYMYICFLTTLHSIHLSHILFITFANLYQGHKFFFKNLDLRHYITPKGYLYIYQGTNIYIYIYKVAKIPIFQHQDL